MISLIEKEMQRFGRKKEEEWSILSKEINEKNIVV